MKLGALLLTRAWPHDDVAADFDLWQRRTHFPQLVGLPGARLAGYYHVVHHAQRPNAPRGLRMALYWSDDVASLDQWLSDPGLADAVRDGSRFFPSFHELDGEPYSGNVYDLGSGTGHAAHDAPALWVERYEVPPEQADTFDRWLEAEHLPALRGAACVTGVRTGRAVRRDFSVPYYNSPGDRLVLGAVTLDDPAAVSATLSELSRAPAPEVPYDRRELAVRSFDARPEGGAHG